MQYESKGQFLAAAFKTHKKCWSKSNSPTLKSWPPTLLNLKWKIVWSRKRTRHCFKMFWFFFPHNFIQIFSYIHITYRTVGTEWTQERRSPHQFLAVKPLYILIRGAVYTDHITSRLTPHFSDVPTVLHSAIDSTEVARGLSVSRARLDRPNRLDLTP